MAKQRGLTLIEMLVSLFILTVVMSVSSAAYRYYVVGFNNNGQKVQTRSANLIRNELVQQQLESAFYYFVQIDPINRRPYFVGTETTVSWVAASSIQQPGVAALSWMGLQNEQPTYCERLLTDSLVSNVPATPEEVCDTFSLPLAESDAFSIRYYGWQNPLQQFAVDSEFSVQADNVTAQWSNAFNSLERKVLPLFVVISLSDDETKQWWFSLRSRDVVKMGIFDDQSQG